MTKTWCFAWQVHYITHNWWIKTLKHALCTHSQYLTWLHVAVLLTLLGNRKKIVFARLFLWVWSLVLLWFPCLFCLFCLLCLFVLFLQHVPSDSFGCMSWCWLCCADYVGLIVLCRLCWLDWLCCRLCYAGYVVLGWLCCDGCTVLVMLVELGSLCCVDCTVLIGLCWLCCAGCDVLVALC